MGVRDPVAAALKECLTTQGAQSGVPFPFVHSKLFRSQSQRTVGGVTPGRVSVCRATVVRDFNGRRGCFAEDIKPFPPSASPFSCGLFVGRSLCSCRFSDLRACSTCGQWCPRQKKPNNLCCDIDKQEMAAQLHVRCTCTIMAPLKASEPRSFMELFVSRLFFFFAQFRHCPLATVRRASGAIAK